MSKYRHDSTPSDFQMDGRFLGFTAIDGYKLKYLRLSTPAGDYTIKIAKELRSTLWRTLVPGEWVHVTGYRKEDACKENVTFKAYQVEATSPGATAIESAPTVQGVPETVSPKASILVCQKSDCCKRGGLAVARALETALRDRQLGQVTIKPTGCMKRCQDGPNIVMPDKTRYSGIAPDAIPALVDKHLCAAAAYTNRG